MCKRIYLDKKRNLHVIVKGHIFREGYPVYIVLNIHKKDTRYNVTINDFLSGRFIEYVQLRNVKL